MREALVEVSAGHDPISHRGFVIVGGVRTLELQ